MKFIVATFTTICLLGIFGFNQETVEKRVIVLDPRYAFFKTHDNQDFSFEIIELVKTRLQQKEYEVLITTEKLTPTSLEERMQFTHKHAADLYVTLSYQNINLLKGRGRNKEITENYMIYPVVGENKIAGNNRDTSFVSKSKAIASRLQTKLTETRTVQPKVFRNAFVYDVPSYGLHLSVYYKPNTAFYETLKNKEYQTSVADALVSTIEQELSTNASR